MMATVRLIVFILIADFLQGQSDSTCRLNSSGKKTGYCKVWLDEKALLTDSVNASFYGYEFYDEDKIPFPRFLHAKDAARYKITFQGNSAKRGNAVPIDGMIKWFITRDGKEYLYLEDSYKNGYAQTFRQYNSGGIAWISYDFTKLYNNMVGSLYGEYAEGEIILKFKKGRKFWVVKKENKWRTIRAD